MTERMSIGNDYVKLIENGNIIFVIFVNNTMMLTSFAGVQQILNFIHIAYTIIDDYGVRLLFIISCTLKNVI